MKKLIYIAFLAAIVLSVQAQNIVRSEYFIDSDPGFGLATPVAIAAPDSDLTLNFNVPVTGLEEGFHTLFIRGQDELGRWSHNVKSLFCLINILPVQLKIIESEYFIDDDPGYGKGTSIPILSPDDSVTLNFNVDLAGIDNGNHTLYIRGKDSQGKWGHILIHAFVYNVSELNENEIEPLYSIYPNPSKGIITIRFEENFYGTPEINVYDIEGKLVHIQKPSDNNNEINLELPKGEYLIKILVSDVKMVQRVVVE